MLQQSDVLSRAEYVQIIAALRAIGTPRAKLREIIFRLTACLGLRAAEVGRLNLIDVELGPVPTLRVRRGKGNVSRAVPLWWDGDTLSALTEWKAGRLIGDDARPEDPLVVTLRADAAGHRINRIAVWAIFRRCVRVLGEERARQLHTHSGRASAVSWWLDAGKSLVECQRALGHAFCSTTSRYLFLVPQDGPVEIGSIFPA
jgi:integrase